MLSSPLTGAASDGTTGDEAGAKGRTAVDTGAGGTRRVEAQAEDASEQYEAGDVREQHEAEMVRLKVQAKGCIPSPNPDGLTRMTSI